MMMVMGNDDDDILLMTHWVAIGAMIFDEDDDGCDSGDT